MSEQKNQTPVHTLCDSIKNSHGIFKEVQDFFDILTGTDLPHNGNAFILDFKRYCIKNIAGDLYSRQLKKIEELTEYYKNEIDKMK